MSNRYNIIGDATIIYVDHKDGRIREVWIDTIDLPLILKYTWNVSPGRNGKLYAKHHSGIYMHRYLMGSIEDGYVVDHKDHDGLNNRKSTNLVVVSNQHNVTRRAGASKNSKSGIRGVYWYEKYGKYKAGIKVSGVKKHLGYYEDKHEAGREVNKALIQFFGIEFAMRTPIKIDLL